MDVKYLHWILLFVGILLIPVSFSYEVDPINATVHQYITNESILVWKNIPYEIKAHAQRRIIEQLDSNYDIGDDIISGSGEEDKGISLPFLRHFWQPDDPDTFANGSGDYNDGLNACFGTNCDSSFVRARRIWMTEVIPNYLNGNINESYYHLGRVAHLLEDATQPGHVHLDPHIGHQLGVCFGLNDDCDDSFLEKFTAQQNYFSDTQGKMNVEHYPGENYTNQHYRYENLIDGFDWNNVDATYANTYGSVIPLFRLFWYTAQKTQYFATEDVNGDTIYVDLDGTTRQFSPSPTENLDYALNYLFFENFGGVDYGV